MYKFALLSLTALIIAFALLAPTESRKRKHYQEHQQYQKVIKRPSVGPRKPAVGPRKQAVGPRKPAAGHLKPAVGHRNPAVGHRNPSVGPRNPAVGHRNPAVEHRSPVRDDTGVGEEEIDPPTVAPTRSRKRCRDHEWTCRHDRSCIDLSDICDHIYDCDDGTDEIYCAENSRCSYRCYGELYKTRCFKECDDGNTTTTTPTTATSSPDIISPTRITGTSSSRRGRCIWEWGECMWTDGGCGPGMQILTSNVARCSAKQPPLEYIECYVSCGMPSNRTVERAIARIIEQHRELENFCDLIAELS